MKKGDIAADKKKIKIIFKTILNNCIKINSATLNK